MKQMRLKKAIEWYYCEKGKVGPTSTNMRIADLKLRNRHLPWKDRSSRDRRAPYNTTSAGIQDTSRLDGQPARKGADSGGGGGAASAARGGAAPAEKRGAWTYARRTPCRKTLLEKVCSFQLDLSAECWKCGI